MVNHYTHTRLLVDGDNIEHIAFHASDDLRAPNGKRVGTLYTCLGMLSKIIDQFSPDEVVIAKSLGNSWRERVYPEYRHTRKKMLLEEATHRPEEYQRRLEFYDERDALADVYTRLALPCVSFFGLEADDIIAILAESKKVSNCVENIIVSTDMDFIQLLRYGKIRMYNPITGVSFWQSARGRVQKDGNDPDVAPSPFCFYVRKLLIGDPSDGIKGFDGIGKKRAADLVKDAPEFRNCFTKGALEMYFKDVLIPKCEKGKRTYEMRLVEQWRERIPILHRITCLKGWEREARVPGALHRAHRVHELYLNSGKDKYFGLFTDKRFDERDPSPLSAYFQRLDFQFAWHRTSLLEFRGRYQTLDARRRALQRKIKRGAP